MADVSNLLTGIKSWRPGIYFLRQPLLMSQWWW
jgi:hypothetical protein